MTESEVHRTERTFVWAAARGSQKTEWTPLVLVSLRGKIRKIGKRNFSKRIVWFDWVQNQSAVLFESEIGRVFVAGLIRPRPQKFHQRTFSFAANNKVNAIML
jgi:hypothetical protein